VRVPTTYGRARSSSLAFILVLILCGCASSPTQSASPSPSAAASEPTNGGTPTEAPTNGVNPTAAAAEAPPTSEELIGSALDSETITYEQSLLYRALALYDSPGLPEAYRSPVPDMGAATELLVEVDEHEAELSAAVLAQLARYRVRPSDPTSIFNTSASQTTALTANALTASGPVWIHELAANGAAQVWVEDTPGAKLRLDRHAQDVTRVWTAMADVFTYPDPDQANDPNPAVNPDAAVDFYWVEASDLDPRRVECSNDPNIEHCVFSSYSAAGFTRRAAPIRVNASSAYFVMDAARGGDAALFQLAHELAHGGQFHYDNAESTWLHEATANWVAYRVFQKLHLPPESAYGWLPKLFERLDAPLTTEADFGGYRAWLYFQFAAMELGDGVVASIWQAAGAQGVQGEHAVDTVFPFETHFADFALRNWNQEPIPLRYRDAPDPTFPELKPKMRVQAQVLRAGDNASLDAALPKLASAYYSYTVDASARTVTFDNSLLGVPGAHVWAIKQIRDAWQTPEDWTSVDHKKFCRDNDEQDLSQLVIIVTNAGMSTNLTPAKSPRIAATATGCPGWRGTMTGTYDWHRSETQGTGKAIFTGIWELAPPDTLVVPCRSVPPGPDDCLAYLPNGSIAWSWDAQQTGIGACDEHLTGSFPAGAANDPRNAGGANEVPLSTQALVLTADGAGHYGYWGAGTWAMPDRMTCGDAELGTYDPPGYFSLSERASGTGAADGTGNTCDHTLWQIDAAASSITGSCYAWNNTGSSLMYQWNLQKVGNAIPAPGG
jgi:hypothetical protein